MAQYLHSRFAYYSPMEGERASTTRQRERGKVCCICSVPIDGPVWANQGERRCSKCELRPHRVHMHFMHFRDGWHVSLALLPDQKPLRRKLTFASEKKLYELARRAQASDEVLDDLKRCIEAWGRGTVKLELTEAQLQALGGVHNG